jgi:hypothetical protein
MRQRQLVGEAGGLCSADAFEQQDVQELFTLLVDVLSTVLKGARCMQPYVCAGRVCRTRVLPPMRTREHISVLPG